MLFLFILLMGLGLFAQSGVKRTFRAYSDHRVNHGLTGAQIAERLLAQNGIMNVRVEATPGELSDHYDPREKVVRLSEPVFGVRSVSATAVAAHEVGHAIQHARGYAPLAIRSALLPAAMAGQQLWMLLLLPGLLLSMMGLVWAAIALYSAAVVFQLVTLPVEFDASRRAGKNLQSMGLVSDVELAGTRKVLRAAAMTYVAAAVASVVTLAYYVMIARR